MRFDIEAIPVSTVDWQPAYRIVPSRFPPVGPWDRIADPADFEALAELEGMTNPRLREELGTLAMIPRDRWVTGPGTTPIMAAFAHLNPEESRFSNGTFGVFYASRELETAIKETVFHRERFLSRTREPAQRIEMRCYATEIRCDLHDVRRGFGFLHDPDDYSQSAQFARQLREEGADGVVYNSVRRSGGECAAIFWPDRIAPCVQSKHLAYHWNGTSIDSVLELTAIEL